VGRPVRLKPEPSYRVHAFSFMAHPTTPTRIVSSPGWNTGAARKIDLCYPYPCPRQHGVAEKNRLRGHCTANPGTRRFKSDPQPARAFS
jgi:hypothetical protein